jgi:hypothetical protein
MMSGPNRHSYFAMGSYLQGPDRSSSHSTRNRSVESPHKRGAWFALLGLAEIRPDGSPEIGNWPKNGRRA